MNETQFWSRVNALLDERLDPFEDREVQKYLRDSREALAQLERLTGRLGALEPMQTVPQKPRIAKIALLAAGITALVAVPKILDEPDATPISSDEVSQVESAQDATLRVPRYRLSVTEVGPQGSRSAVIEDGRITRAVSTEMTTESSDSRPDRIRLTVERISDNSPDSFTRRLP